MFTILLREAQLNEGFGYRLSLFQTPGLPPLGAPPEYLQAFTCSHDVVVRWSSAATGFGLQHIGELDASIPSSSWLWQDIPGPYHQLSGYYYVTNPIPGEMGFFRLFKP